MKWSCRRGPDIAVVVEYREPHEVDMGSDWRSTEALLRGYYGRLIGVGALMAAVPVALLAVHPLAGGLAALLCWPQAMVLAGMGATRAVAPVVSSVRVTRVHGEPLLALVAEVAAKVGGLVPDEVRVAWDGRVRVYPLGGGPRRRPRWVLVVGAGALAWLSAEELRAVIARELARYDGTNAVNEGWLVAALLTIDEMWWYRPWLALGAMQAYGKVVRQERKRRRAALLPRGDAVAVAVAGREAADAALVRRLEAEQLAAWHEQRVGPVTVRSLREWATRPEVAAELAAERAAALDRSDPGWPTLASRLERPELWHEGRSPETDAAAATLVPGLEALMGGSGGDADPLTGLMGERP